MQDSNRYAATANNLGNVFFHSGNYDEALSYYFQAIESHVKNQAEEKLAPAYGNLPWSIDN